MSNRIEARMSQLTHERVPFVHATVVRAQKPAPVRPGDAAIILADGSIEGFVGGQCAEGSVRVAALDVLRRGDSLLLRVLPSGEEQFPESSGARVVTNPCLSGGQLEIFLEPLLPPPLLHVVGTTPTAGAVAALAEPLGFAARLAGPTDKPSDATAVIVATHGREEPEPIRAALDAGVAFIGLVASRKRGSALLDELGLTEDERQRIRTPVGLPIGARTPQEVALSILAEVVRAIRVEGLDTAPPPTGPVPPPSRELLPLIPADHAIPVDHTALDPVCGMTVIPGPSTPRFRQNATDYWFCCLGCRDQFAAEAAQRQMQ